jgi:integrase
MARPRGSGSITIRQTAKGPVFYGQWWLTPAQKVSRRLGPVRGPGSKVGLTPNMAEAELRRKMAEVVAPTEPRRSGTSFGEAGKLYLAHLKRAGRKKSTIAAVESCLRVWLIPFFKGKAMGRVTYHDVEDLVAAMEQKSLEPKSVKNYIGTLSSMYVYGINPRRGWATANPVDGVELPAIQEHVGIRFLEPEQVDALIRHVPDGPYRELDRVLWRVAAMTGLRQGELIALRWQDVDWPVSRLRVRRSFVLGEFGTPKSRRSSRAVPLALEVQQALAAWQPVDAAEDDLVFPDPLTGGPLASNAAILRRFRAALDAAGLPPHRFHDLRHTFGTRMAAAGVPLRTLQEWMGHGDIQTTMRYADYSPSAHEAAMVDAAFARPNPEGEQRAIRATSDVQEST